MKTAKIFLHLCLIGLFTSFLSSCMNAAVTGAQAVYSHHSITASLKDHYIALQAEREIYLDKTRFKNTNVSVSSFNGVVLLTGQVENVSERREIEKIVRNISGVKEIHNVLTISPRPSPLSRISDTWITTKIKSKLIAMKDVDPTQIKVITENGTVYLIGIVLPEQADIAVDIARSTEGVQQVVKVFSYIHISKIEHENKNTNEIGNGNGSGSGNENNSDSDTREAV